MKLRTIGVFNPETPSDAKNFINMADESGYHTQLNNNSHIEVYEDIKSEVKKDG